MVDLPVYVEKAVALEVLSAFMEELRSESVNLCTRKRLDAILLAATNVEHRIDQLRRQLKHLLQRIGVVLPLTARFVLSNNPPRSANQGQDYCIVNVLLIMAYKFAPFRNTLRMCHALIENIHSDGTSSSTKDSAL
jgi:hypothetical protein